MHFLTKIAMQKYIAQQPARMEFLAEGFKKTADQALNRILEYDMLLYTANKSIQSIWPAVEDRIEIVFQRRRKVEIAGEIAHDMKPELIRVKRSQYGWYQERFTPLAGKKLEMQRPMRNGRDYPDGQKVKMLLRLIEGWLAEREALEEVLRQFRQRTGARVRRSPLYRDGLRDIKAIL